MTVEDLSYRAAHYRVRALRGPASDHPCASCDGPAEQWSYAGPIPPPLVDDRGCAYSPDPRHVVPRCRKCHAFADRPAYCKRGHLLFGDNVYVNRLGHRKCRACRVLARSQQRESATDAAQTRT